MLTAETITDEQIRELRADPDLTVRNEAEMASSDFHRVMGPGRHAEARARCAEILNARTPECDFHDSHDRVADLPTGNRCGVPATHRLEWDDGRYSFGCDAHLVIDGDATVKPIRIVPLNANGHR